MAFIIGLPVMQMIIFCVSIGKDPVGLKVAIVNNELNNSLETCIPSTGCDTINLSCRFLKHLEKRTVEFIPYDTDEEARYAIKKGWAWAAITFPSNYSESLMKRIEDGQSVDEFDIMYSDMDVVMDMSSKYIFKEKKL